MSFPVKLLLPQYWPNWLLVAILWGCSKLPYRFLLKLGAGLGRLLMWVMPDRVHTARVNLAHCFPEWSEEKRQQVVKESFNALGVGFFEASLAWWGSARRIQKLAHLYGVEHLSAALAKKRGILLLSYHNPALEICARMMAQHCQPYMFYRPQKNKVIEYVSQKARQRYSKGIILRTEMRRTIQLLQENEMIFYLPDQDYGRKHSVFVPFFAEPKAATITMTARLTQTTGAAVILVHGGRLPNSTGYEVHIDAPLTDFPSGDDAVDARRINQIIEQAIAQRPEQYMWLHRRFKTRPQGEPSFY